MFHVRVLLSGSMVRAEEAVVGDTLSILWIGPLYMREQNVLSQHNTVCYRTQQHNRLPMEEGKVDFTVLKGILDHFTEFELYKNLNGLLSLCVYVS